MLKLNRSQSAFGFVMTVTILSVVAAARASTIPGRWEMVEKLPPGSAVEVKLRSQAGIEGELLEAEGAELLLRVPSGARVRVPRDQVLVLWQLRTVSSHSNRWIGLAVGLGAGLAVGATQRDDPGDLVGNRINRHAIPVASALGGITGFVSGLLLERKKTVKRELYRAPPDSNREGDSKSQPTQETVRAKFGTPR